MAGLLIRSTLLLLLSVIVSQQSANAFSPPSRTTIIPKYGLSISSQKKSSFVSKLEAKWLSEDDLAKPPNPKVLDAIEAMGNNNRMIASDVASKAGVSLSEAKTSLSALAALTGGDLAVSKDGDLIYIFDQGASIKSKLASKNLRYRIQQYFFKNIWPKLFYAIRISFGLVLLVSIFAIFSTIFFVSTASGGSSNDDDRRGGDRRMSGGGYGMGNFMFDVLFPRNYFYYQPYYGYYGRYDPYTRSQYYQQEEEEEEEPNMLERIFCYIFGDGNPNRNMEAARLKMAANVIRQNGGAVIAEQLAPYCDAPAYKSVTSSNNVDESYVLPIVSQLGGEPTVTDDGDIVYVFPELQVSASSSSSKNILEVAGLPPNASAGQIKNTLSNVYGINTRDVTEKSYLLELLDKVSSTDSTSMNMLEEQELEFNRNGSGWNLFAGILGGVNLGGALYLGNLLSSPALMGYRLPAWYGLVQAGFPFLLGYAVLFNLIPAARTLYNSRENEQIRTRNANRKSWLTNKSSYSQKLKAASNFAKRLKQIGSANDDVIYETTDNDKTVSQQKAKADLNDFDQKLKNLQEGDDNDIFQ